MLHFKIINDIFDCELFYLAHFNSGGSLEAIWATLMCFNSGGFKTPNKCVVSILAYFLFHLGGW